MSNQTKTALIIGASRGIGLGLVKEFQHRSFAVTATVRQAAQAPEGITTLVLDMNNHTQESKFMSDLGDKQFDVIVINAGISGPTHKDAENVTADEISHLMITNAISPVRLGAKLLPHLRPKTGVMGFMSSILGSVALASGSWPLYSASKAALNSLTKSFAAKLPAGNITILTLHPGWVQTDMGGSGADITVDVSVKGLADVLTKQAGSHKHQYLDYQGKTLPW